MKPEEAREVVDAFFDWLKHALEQGMGAKYAVVKVWLACDLGVEDTYTFWRLTDWCNTCLMHRVPLINAHVFVVNLVSSNEEKDEPLEAFCGLDLRLMDILSFVHQRRYPISIEPLATIYLVLYVVRNPRIMFQTTPHYNLRVHAYDPRLHNTVIIHSQHPPQPTLRRIREIVADLSEGLVERIDRALQLP